MFRTRLAGAGIGQDERAGAIGRLGIAGRQARLTDHRGLLIPGHATDRDTPAEQRRFGKTPRTIDDLRQGAARRVEQFDQPVAPPAAAKAHQKGAGGIGGIGDVQPAAIVPGGQLPDQPAFDRADRQPLARVAQLRPIGHRPGDLGPAEIGIEQQAGARLHAGFLARILQLAADVGAAPVLPHDRGRQRLAGGLVPEYQRFALVGDADRGDRVRPARFLDHGPGALRGLGPDFGRIMFDQPRRRIMLRQRRRPRGEAAAVGGEQHRAGRCRPLVDDKQFLSHRFIVAKFGPG